MSAENVSVSKPEPEIQEFIKDGYKGLMESIKHSNSLPTDDRTYYNKFESFNGEIKHQTHAVLHHLNDVLNKINVRPKIHNRPLESKTELLVDANDSIFENISNRFDVMNGIKKPEKLSVVSQPIPCGSRAPVHASWNINRMPSMTWNVSKGFNCSRIPNRHLSNYEHIARPQDSFEDKIDNSSENLWMPKIKEKPNSLKPLAIFLEETEYGNAYSHPYQFELDKFQPSKLQLLPFKLKIPIPKALGDTPLVEINEVDQLDNLVKDLLGCRIIGVDVEHNSYRSFMGITCLLQISTPQTDYIIDTLKLRNHLWVLNEVFTKPEIVKVFHGAQQDIIWLQRDLSLYVVNMFDTFFAAKRLNFERLSLAHLIETFCYYTPDKQLQLADWRLRPLTDEMKQYARTDTHFLIFIYENLKRLLVRKSNGSNNLLQAVFNESTELCKQIYIKPVYTEDSHLEFYRKCNRTFDNRQMYALKGLYKWRDEISRIKDESPGYVLPNNMLLEIAEKLPREMQGILACCNPIPSLVRENQLELHKILLKALEQPYEEPILQQTAGERGAKKYASKMDLNNLLYSPADLKYSDRFVDVKPTLLENSGMINKPTKTRSSNSKLAKILTETESEFSDNLYEFRKTRKYLSPFERYQLIRPLIHEQMKKYAEKKKKEQEQQQKEKNSTTSEAPEQSTINEDDRTDEDRIESIRNHFLDLSQQSNQSCSETKNDDEVKAGMKRKHESEDSQQDTSAVENVIDLTDDSVLVIDIPDEDDSEPVSKKRNVDNLKDEQQKTSKNNKPKKWKISLPPKKAATLNRRKRKRRLEPEVNSFDYSMVDFRQFEGGARPANKRSQFENIPRTCRKKVKRLKKGNRKLAI